MGSGRSVVVAFLLGIILAAFLCEVADGAEFTPVMAWTGAAPSGACAGNRVSVIASTGAHYCCVTGTWTACGGSSTIPWANVTGTPTTLSGYGVTAVAWSVITATPTTLVGYGITDAAPKASPIFTGTVTAPTFSGALSGNAATASALLSDPSDCTGNNFSLGINASGTAQCAQPSFSNLSGTATAAQIPAATAVALGGVKGFTGLTFVTGDLSLTASNITSVLGATSVQNATNAGTATNATQLGGVAAASYLQASTAATTYAPIGSKYLTMGSDATLSAEVAVPTCSGTDKLTSNGTAITCATDQTVAYTLPDATASVKGGIQLSGDLGGTAAAPTVPGLAGKAPTASPTFTGTVSAAAATTTGMLTGNQITSTTGQIFAGTNNALLLRSYVPSDASSPFTANIIDTNLTMTNAGSKLLAINNGSFLKSYFDKDGNFSGNAASATTAADSAKLGGTAAASYLLSSTAASTYAPIASPTFTGTVTAPTFSGALSGNASTASALAANPADCTGNNFSLGIDATGAAQCAQPAFSNLSGSIAATQIIAPTTTTFGGVKAKTCTGSDKVSAIGADGVPVCTADQGGSSALVLPSGLTQYGVQQIPFDATIANGTNYGYLILAKAYVSGSQPDSEVTGTITLSRGGTASANRTDVLTVWSKSAYQTEHLFYNEVYNTNYSLGTVKVTCSGTQYHAIKLYNVGGWADMGATFSGVAVNSGLISLGAVPASACSGEVSFGAGGGFLTDVTTGVTISAHQTVAMDPIPLYMQKAGATQSIAKSGGPLNIGAVDANPVNFFTNNSVRQAIDQNGATNFYGNVTVNGDLYSYRSGGTSGVIWLDATQARYLYWSGTRYELGDGSKPLLVGNPVNTNEATTLQRVWDEIAATSGSANVSSAGTVLSGGGKVAVSHPQTGVYNITVPANCIPSFTANDGTGNTYNVTFTIATSTVGSGTYQVKVHNGSGTLIDIGFTLVYARIW